MNKFKLYRQMKNEYAYSLFKNNQSFEKVRALIIQDGKILLVHKIKSNKYALPGGGVENGENIEVALERECYEEAKARVKMKSIVGVLNYDVNMTYNGESFISKRIEYYCLCEFLNFVKKKKYFGLNGEFFERVEVVWHSIDQLDKTDIGDYVINKIKALTKMNLISNSKKENKLNVENKKLIENEETVKSVKKTEFKAKEIKFKKKYKPFANLRKKDKHKNKNAINKPKDNIKSKQKENKVHLMKNKEKRYENK